MHVFRDMSMELAVGNHYIENFEDYASGDPEDKSVLMCIGHAAMFKHPRPAGYSRYVYLEAEEPTTLNFSGKLPHERDNPIKWSLDDWDLILHSQSPSVTKYLNGIYNTDKYVPIMIPIHEKWCDPTAEKKYSVGYCGGTHEVHSCPSAKTRDPTSAYDPTILKQIVREIRTFPDSIHISAWPDFDATTGTHFGITDAHKMKVLNETKITVIKNSHFGNYNTQARKLPDWDKYEWTSHIMYDYAPQLKSRVSEACLCKNLMLVHRDPWNEIEHFLKPDKHFIYFDNVYDMSNKIKMCLDNWDKYEKIVEDAYTEFMRKWSTSAFYHRWLKPWDSYDA